MDYNQNIRGII